MCTTSFCLALSLAITYYFPHLGRKTGNLYAHLFIVESQKVGLDPLLAASRCWVESGFRVNAVEPKAGNYGLMMIKRRDFNPQRNIHRGVEILSFWQAWHRDGKCKQKPKHHWVLHYCWGFVVPRRRRITKGLKFDRVYKLLKDRMCVVAKKMKGGRSIPACPIP